MKASARKSKNQINLISIKEFLILVVVLWNKMDIHVQMPEYSIWIQKQWKVEKWF
ncbi:hypothetical protein [Xenorhabdus vietnamensis]|uniref:hypothetical protein n=1 Tax=Xenorhabdus vietnamensis TaxID=351656 RepID=UPI00142D2B10|nr:hypothetical protein [Xenorhabdus vietnamensis]